MSSQMTDAQFETRTENAISDLEHRFSELADDHDIDVAVQGNVLSVTFEEGEPGKFIVSPNSSVRQLWVSARVASYKFDWSGDQDGFVLAGSGEPLLDVMVRLTREQLQDDSIKL